MVIYTCLFRRNGTERIATAETFSLKIDFRSERITFYGETGLSKKRDFRGIGTFGEKEHSGNGDTPIWICKTMPLTERVAMTQSLKTYYLYFAGGGLLEENN
uniref:LAGLIDADG homing endonuclease n=1 Tax=Romanomermis culicivorax TaxID=13658 RepID=A0A915JHV2_ROMCU